MAKRRMIITRNSSDGIEYFYIGDQTWTDNLGQATAWDEVSKIVDYITSYPSLFSRPARYYVVERKEKVEYSLGRIL